jgi:predicted helicase
VPPVDLRTIKTFPQLVKYLRDELDWPIESTDFEELTFDYSADELGLDSSTAAKIKEIKQLRPLESKQPWGIFFVNFQPQRLPVVALRRILRSLVVKKRQSATKAQQATWHLHDLLFISSYGESDHRDITFAHFSEEAEHSNLPVLRVLGWDDEDTALHTAYTDKMLREKLCWPKDIRDIAKWQSTWSSAFTLKHLQVVKTSKELALRLADLAQKIRKRAKTVLAIENEKGPLRKLQAAFKEALIHDLTDDDFADMYAQTISYGLLTARISRPSGLVADNLKDMVPVTNPFLKELLETFLNVGGRKGKIDFDELGISEVVELLRDADMEAVLRDFGDRNPDEDPAIHFYELFLKEYDPKKRMQRGVFYTPRPVVSFIVRSVHEALKKEFGLTDGLADTSTWMEMTSRHKVLSIPEGVAADTPFVNILDPATGTGTFLVEAIEIVYETMRKKWLKEGHMALEIQNLWNQYVPKHLLPRVYGYELLMAPYAIAHMKIGLKLYETGYRFGSDARARIYLTNSLEPATNEKQQREFEEWAPALAHEAKAVNEVKRRQRFTVVIGNPPYSNLSANLTETSRALVEKYKFIGVERVTERNALQLERNLNDDYVKFMAWTEDRLSDTRVGILSMISNNVYTWSPSLRGMRAHVLGTFSQVRILDLHGASQRGPAESRFANDKNVFDIEQPVAIGMLSSTWRPRNTSVDYAEVVGTREAKYQLLLQQSFQKLNFEQAAPGPPAWRFVPSNSEFEEYGSFLSLASTCPLFAEGIKTGRDWLVIDFDKEPVLKRMEAIQASNESDDRLCSRIGLSRKKAWNFGKARSVLAKAHLSEWVTKLAYRPFDMRFVFYHPDWVASSSMPVMRNLRLARTVERDASPMNLALVVGRTSRDHTSLLYWCSRDLTDKGILSSLDNVSVFPALVFPARSKTSLDFGQVSPELNLSTDFLSVLHKTLGLEKPDADAGALTNWTFDIFYYFYALLWSPSYRIRYAGELTVDFPRLPLTGDLSLFRALALLGGDLVSFHLMESSKLDQAFTSYTGSKNPEVGNISYGHNTVWLDKTHTSGFRDVPYALWSFRVGGYNVCEKWLKDRKGRTLSKDDINHYQRIVVALTETIRIMAEIDKVIDAHGGWPGAFATGAKAAGGAATS